MALDFHRLDNEDYLFSLDSAQYKNLDAIFTTFKHITGIYIDEYNDVQLTVANQKILLRIIHDYVLKNNLDTSKQKAVDIIEFGALLNFFANNNCDIQTFAD